MNLQPSSSEYPVVWEWVTTFRSTYSDDWFVPSTNELVQAMLHKDLLEKIKTDISYGSGKRWTSTEADSDASMQVRFNYDDRYSQYKNSHNIRVRLGRYLSSKKTISISCSTSQSQIYYTDNNSDPTSFSNLYSSIFQTEDGNIIKAIATREGWDDSNIAILDTSTSTISTEYIPEITRQSENNKTLTEDSNKNIS